MSTNALTETKLFDNKQLIHVISELVAMFGIIYYFSSKNKQLLGYIEELNHRLEEKDEQYGKLEKMVLQLTQKVNLLLTERPIQNRVEQKTSSESKQSKEQNNKRNSEHQPIYSPKRESTKREQQPVEFVNPKRQTPLSAIEEEENTEEVEETNDSDLDNEIREELNELVEDDTILKGDD